MTLSWTTGVMSPVANAAPIVTASPTVPHRARYANANMAGKESLHHTHTKSSGRKRNSLFDLGRSNTWTRPWGALCMGRSPVRRRSKRRNRLFRTQPVSTAARAARCAVSLSRPIKAGSPPRGCARSWGRLRRAAP
jgi:hypothetical protein